MAEVQEIINSIINNTFGVVEKINPYFYIFVVIVLMMFSLFLIKIYSSKIKQKNRYIHIQDSILNSLKSGMGIEKFSETMLELFCPLIDSQSYGFYIFDKNADAYIMKAIKYSRDDLVEVGPSYSGLAPYKKEDYIQPASLKKDAMPEKIGILKDGNVPVLTIPIEGGIGMIRIVPVRSYSMVTKANIFFISKRVKSIFDMILEIETIKSQVDSVVTAGSAMHGIMKTFNSSDGLLFTMLGIIIKQTLADAGFYIKKMESDIKAGCFVNLKDEFVNEISSDKGTKKMLSEISAGYDISFLGREQPDFYKLPPYFSLMGIEGLLLLNIKHPSEQGTAVIIFKKRPDINYLQKNKAEIIKYIILKINEMFNFREESNQLSASFQNTIKSMMLLIDNLNPYTVGYSRLMGQFAYIIAMEMGIDEQEGQDIYLAAYLSNIGVLGLSNDIFFKSGKYSEIEYKAMRLHSEVGAAIIENSIGNNSAANYVLHHHERIDGLGYPSGLKGGEIPMGSKIIGVVQFFIAKISGRSGREPVSLDEALFSLKNASGTQLDTDAVNALADWFRKKRSKYAKPGCSLGPCWEMRCCPVEICRECPAYGIDTGKCWEFNDKGTKCSAHGNECNTCFIRSEVYGRK